MRAGMVGGGALRKGGELGLRLLQRGARRQTAEESDGRAVQRLVGLLRKWDPEVVEGMIVKDGSPTANNGRNPNPP
jgi:hypothetical protein